MFSICKGMGPMNKNRNKKDITICSFCGKSKDSVDNLFTIKNVAICNECIQLAYQIMIYESKYKSIKNLDAFNVILNKTIIAIEPDLKNLLDSSIIKKYYLIPYQKRGRKLYILTINQKDLNKLEKIIKSRYKIVPEFILFPVEELIKRTIN